MGKERTKLYEEIQFSDYAYAMEIKANAEEQLNKIDKIWIIAIIGSICGVIGFLNEIVLLVAFIMACVCYHQVGGFSTAARWSWNFAKFGWFVVPYFPIDLAVGGGCFFVGLFALFFVPFFTVWHLKKQANKNIEAADRYIRLYQSEVNGEVTN